MSKSHTSSLMFVAPQHTPASSAGHILGQRTLSAQLPVNDARAFSQRRFFQQRALLHRQRSLGVAAHGDAPHWRLKP
jgi:hypothetical protein